MVRHLLHSYKVCHFCEQVVFGGFSAEALSQRILDCRPNIVLTTSGVRRGAKVIKLKEIVDEALERVLSEGFAVGMPFFQHTILQITSPNVIVYKSTSVTSTSTTFINSLPFLLECCLTMLSNHPQGWVPELSLETSLPHKCRHIKI
jgi:hypothetical protein